MKVGIVGCGLVGSTAGYAMVMQGIGREIVMVDKKAARAEAEADDIQHAVPFAHPLRVSSGTYADLTGSQVVVVAAGVNQKPGESRLQLLQRNYAVFSDVVPNILKHAPDAMLVVATNPVDAMTHLTAHFAAKAGWPTGRVLGSGTTLDTARFRTLLGAFCGVDAHHVHAYVVGEHGDSEVLTWSLVTVGGLPLEEFTRLRGITLDDRARAFIDDKVRHAAYAIIQGKGATYFGIGSALARIVSALLHDQRAVLTVCAPLTDMPDVTYSLPRLVSGQGVLATFPLPLDDHEREQLRGSAEVIRKAIAYLGF